MTEPQWHVQALYLETEGDVRRSPAAIQFGRGDPEPPPSANPTALSGLGIRCCRC